MGLTGSGKGKQSELLSNKTGFPVASTGGRLREMAKGGDSLGKKIAGVMSAGELMSSWFVQYIFQQTLLGLGEDDGVIFEGACRMEAEAHLFNEVCGWLGRDYRIIHINVSEKTVAERLRKRQQIEGRKDDDPSVLQNRLKNFYEHTAPAIEYFRSLNKVIEIDGEPLPEVVAVEVWEKVSSL